MGKAPPKGWPESNYWRTDFFNGLIFRGDLLITEGFLSGVIFDYVITFIENSAGIIIVQCEGLNMSTI